MAEYFDGQVVLCGGRDKTNQVMDTCMSYSLSEDKWADHSVLLEDREESASVVVSGQVSQIIITSNKSKYGVI